MARVPEHTPIRWNGEVIATLELCGPSPERSKIEAKIWPLRGGIWHALRKPELALGTMSDEEMS